MYDSPEERNCHSCTCRMTVKGVVQESCPVDMIQVSVKEMHEDNVDVTVPNIQYPPLSAASKSVMCCRRSDSTWSSLYSGETLWTTCIEVGLGSVNNKPTNKIFLFYSASVWNLLQSIV